MEQISRNLLSVEDLEDNIGEKDSIIKQLNCQVYMLIESLKRLKNDRKEVENSLKKSVEDKTQRIVDLEKLIEELTRRNDREIQDLIRAFENEKAQMLKEIEEKIEAEDRKLKEVEAEIKEKNQMKQEKEKYEREMADCQEKNKAIEQKLKEINYEYMLKMAHDNQIIEAENNAKFKEAALLINSDENLQKEREIHENNQKLNERSATQRHEIDRIK